MSAGTGYVEWYESGPFAPYARERRIAGGSAQMLEVAQPAGDFSDPATADILIFQVVSSAVSQRSDFGGGLFETSSRAGELVIVAPGTATRIVVHNEHAIRILALPSRLWRAQLEEASRKNDPFDFGRMHDRPFADPFALALMDRLWMEADRGDDLGRLYCDSMISALMLGLRRAADSLQPAAPISGGLAPWQERRCTEYLRDNAAEDVDLATLAAVANLSPFHFARMFKRTTGVPPHRYQLLVRLERAKQMLVETDMSVLEIALAVGYDAPQTLARLFRREMGTTPSAYRRERRS